MARASDSKDDEEEALSWAGDELRGGVDPLTRNRAAQVGASSIDEGVDAAPAPPTNLARTAATVGFALVYLAIVVGWILVQITGSPATDLFAQVAWQFGEFVAIVAGALWYLAVLTLIPDARTAVRVGWFALGVVVLVPWPVLLAAVS